MTQPRTRVDVPCTDARPPCSTSEIGICCHTCAHLAARHATSSWRSMLRPRKLGGDPMPSCIRTLSCYSTGHPWLTAWHIDVHTSNRMLNTYNRNSAVIPFHSAGRDPPILLLDTVLHQQYTQARVNHKLKNSTAPGTGQWGSWQYIFFPLLVVIMSICTCLWSQQEHLNKEIEVLSDNHVRCSCYDKVVTHYEHHVMLVRILTRGFQAGFKQA
jgi:hypothetical protein